MDALDMLTEDCWIEVFRKVVSAADLKACSETCVIFETILDRRRSSWMLGVIMPFLFNYLNHQEEEKLPFWQPILRTRLVSRTLCHAVDTYIEANFHDHCYFDCWKPVSYYLNHRRGERMDEFLQTFETHRGNPFIGRHVGITQFHRDNLSNSQRYNEEDRHQESVYMGRVVNFLGKFGHHIWTLAFHEQECWQHLSFCKALQLLLCHLPNLRNLDISQCNANRYDEPELLDESYRLYGIDELVPYLAAHPLPALPHLETLDAEGLSIKMGQPLVEKYSPHLKSLKMFDCRPFLKYAGRFNCLEELELRVDAQNTLEGLILLQSPLEKLTIEARWDNTNLGLYDIRALLLNLRHLPLTDLQIESVCFIGESAPISPDLQIDSIRKLHILRRGPRMDISFNFLLCLPKLKEVRMSLERPRNITSPHPNGIPEVLFVKELVSDGDLYTSDIWKRIPSLKKFSFNYRGHGYNVVTNSYNRDGYEEWRLKEMEKVLSNN